MDEWHSRLDSPNCLSEALGSLLSCHLLNSATFGSIVLIDIKLELFLKVNISDPIGTFKAS
jgi:hypothetical protein